MTKSLRSLILKFAWMDAKLLENIHDKGMAHEYFNKCLVNRYKRVKYAGMGKSLCCLFVNSKGEQRKAFLLAGSRVWVVSDFHGQTIEQRVYQTTHEHEFLRWLRSQHGRHPTKYVTFVLGARDDTTI